jgi:threonine dehydratase
MSSRHAHHAHAHDEQVRHAMSVAFETLQLVLEPGGAAGLAAVLAGKLEVTGRTVAVIGSGGNIPLAKFAKTLGCQQGSSSAARL